MKHFCSENCFHWKDFGNCEQCNMEFPKETYNKRFCDSICERVNKYLTREDMLENIPPDPAEWYQLCLKDQGQIVQFAY